MAIVKEYIKDSMRVFVVPVEILEIEDLSIYEKMVYITLRSYANAHKAEAFPSYATIAKMGSMSRRQAMRCVQNLIEKGLIQKETRFDVTKNKEIRQTSNLYTLQSPQQKAVTDSHQCPPVTGVVTDSHRGSDSESPENNHLKEPINNNGWMGDPAPEKNNESTQDENIQRDWKQFKDFCIDNGIDGSQGIDLYKVWRTHYNAAPVSIVIAMLRELLNDKIVFKKDGWTEQEYKNFVGLFHHRMKVWKEMAVAFDDEGWS